MFDFKKRMPGGGPGGIDSTDRIAVFGALDLRTSHTTLRDPQREALTELSRRHGERDLVLKLSTGGGKTTTALVHLHAYLLTSKAPCVYVAPRRQLVRQVLQEAKALGIPAVEYPPDERYPAPEAHRGEAVLVCTYDKMFNAKSTFLRDDVRLVPHALVLDDAHAGIEEIRDNFTLRFPLGTPAHSAVLAALAPARTYHSARWVFIDRQDPTALVEIPYWLWSELVPSVTAAIAENVDERSIKFVWGHLRERLRWCRCFVSGSGIEIGPILPFTSDFAPFSGAKHRLFASATLADDSVLVRELGCSVDAVRTPIIPPSDAGVGERMVIAPSLVDRELNRDWVMNWCARAARSQRVVVLCPSEKRARDWAGVGARLGLGEDVDLAVDGLRTGTETFVVFAQRYDGVDLPDDACRVLVLDGIPQAPTLGEQVDAGGSHGGAALYPTVHRIEQGMGRAVRSHVDYAVVVLAGEELATFVSNREVERHMGVATRAQIELAHELARMAREEGGAAKPEQRFAELAATCLRRDPDWKQFYDQRVRQVARAARHTVDDRSLVVAAAERAAVDAALRGDAHAAVVALQPGLDHHADDLEKGRLLERLACYQWESDHEAAFRTQRSAHQANRYVAIPPTPPTGRRPPSASQPQAVSVIRWYLGFSKAGAASAAIVALRPRLDFSVAAAAFEAALKELGMLLGAASTRPEDEEGRGPDILWAWGAGSWVIEAKNERGSLPKADGEQLLAAMKWHQESYPERSAQAVVIASPTQCEWDAYFPDDTRVMTPELMARLLTQVGAFVVDLAAMDPQDESQAERVRAALSKHKLGQEQLLAEYTTKLSKRARR
ncbi:MAG: DEAD/DEAH box helicase family protein [Sandaracinus sp.]